MVEAPGINLDILKITQKFCKNFFKNKKIYFFTYRFLLVVQLEEGQ